MSAMLALVAVVAFACAHLAAAGAFLRPNHHTTAHVRREFLDQSLATALAADATKLAELEQELSPIYAALPKNAEGKLEPAVVRYAMHRYFGQKHAWVMKGLDPAAKAANGSSPAGVLEDRVPAYIQDLFADHLHGQGFGLHELAVFAATLADLVLKEEMRRLEDSYSSIGLNPVDTLDEMEIHELVEAYLVKFLLPDESNITTYGAMKLEVEQLFVGWSDTLMWADDMCRALDYSEETRRNPFVAGTTADHAAAIVREIGNRFGAFQQQECQSMKDKLFEMEIEGTGRVLLSDFYRVGLEGVWNFAERAEYLRHIGALDDTDRRHPALVIPNYVASYANCVGSSSFFTACCQNECESLMGRLERELAAPLVLPEEVVAVVSRLPSETVDAPRTLSTVLLSRLGAIAEHHDGWVPIHGRLFAQWMHHAYPRECPFPHGRQQVSAEEWEASSGQEAALTDADLQAFVGAMTVLSDDRKVEDLPWDIAEEVLSNHVEGRGLFRAPPWRKAAALLAIASLAVPLVHTYNTFLAKVSGPGGEKQMV